jgi:hypothetical protein
MTTHANVTLDLEWPSGRPCPAGIAPQAASKSTNDFNWFLALFLLEGAHTTLRSSNPKGVQDPQNSGLLGTSLIFTWCRKALFTANAARARKYNRNRSMPWRIGAERRPMARER